MTPETLIARHAPDLARLLDADPATDLDSLHDDVVRAADAAPAGVDQSYRTAARFLRDYARQPLLYRPTLLQYVDDHLADALAATA